ncbi:MAG TPA: hypothetical protein VFK57_21955 [Vicinamibacterales bacterium]|nr:hypothetical protein [Vicinamibacterales bacterium]
MRRSASRPAARGLRLAAAIAAAAVAGCAPKAPIALPTGAGTPFPAFASAFDDATRGCRGVTTITASMAMSGRAGSTKLRGRIDAGFAAPDRARLEGRHPVFGRPVFVLVAGAGRGTLVLTRDDRVLRDAPPERIVEALAGVPLGAEALRTAISGCGFGGVPGDGREFPNGWVAAPVDGGTIYLQRADAAWHVAAASRGGVTIAYADYAGGRPSTIRIRAESAGRTNADVTLRLSDVEINTTLDPRTFQIELPDRPIPLSLDELRKAGPLGGS